MNNSETLITKERPHCDNCKFSHNNFSSIFGDAWTCLKDVKNHYDIFRLIEKGKAIDVNTLKVNPYKIKKHDSRTK